MIEKMDLPPPFAATEPEPPDIPELPRSFHEFNDQQLSEKIDHIIENSDWTDEQKALVRDAGELSATVHAGQERADGMHFDHIRRVFLLLYETLGIRDPELFAAAYLHDSLEDQARRLIEQLSNEPLPEGLSEAALRERAFALLQEKFEGTDIAQTIMDLSNPLVDEEAGESKVVSYVKHTYQLIRKSPKGRVIKLADFIDNAVNNDQTPVAAKRVKLDLKYKFLYFAHRMGLHLPDSLVPPENRKAVDRILKQGDERGDKRIDKAKRGDQETMRAAKRKLFGKTALKAIEVQGKVAAVRASQGVKLGVTALNRTYKARKKRRAKTDSTDTDS